MHEISNTSAIGSIIIGAENRDILSTTRCCIEHQWYEMGLGIMGLSNLAIWISARRVEVSQSDPFQSMRLVEIGEHSLDHQLRCTIGIDRTLCCFLRYGE